VWLSRFGPAALLLSWVPVIGDALCVASDGCART
jgi:membrane protein YqaA with SNARE-associated domain